MQRVDKDVLKKNTFLILRSCGKKVRMVVAVRQREWNAYRQSICWPRSSAAAHSGDGMVSSRSRECVFMVVTCLSWTDSSSIDGEGSVSEATDVPSTEGSYALRETQRQRARVDTAGRAADLAPEPVRAPEREPEA